MSAENRNWMGSMQTPAKFREYAASLNAAQISHPDYRKH